MAAGSEGSGYWFELKNRVRGPSAPLHPGVKPNTLPLKSFVGNVAHSNYVRGLATYPGYNPTEEAAFVDLQMYRNRGSGFFAVGGFFLVQGGIFADNRVGIAVDRAYSLRVIDAQFVGITPSFADSVSASGKTGQSPSLGVIGVMLHSLRGGGSSATGVVLQDLHFAHFGEGTQCPGSSGEFELALRHSALR